MASNPLDWSQLASGSRRQREAWEALAQLGIMAILEQFTPALAGTFPLDIDVETSDLDVICCARHLAAFEKTLVREFGSMAEFRTERTIVRGVPTVMRTSAMPDSPFRYSRSR